MQHVFTMEQEEYRSENISWDYIHYTDNRPTLDLLALKPMSIISLLDEESRFPQVCVRACRPSGGGPAMGLLLEAGKLHLGGPLVLRVTKTSARNKQKSLSLTRQTLLSKAHFSDCWGPQTVVQRVEKKSWWWRAADPACAPSSALTPCNKSLTPGH